jgi:hypothetical protein
MSEGQMQTTGKPTAAFVLSLLAGLWMLAAGGMMGGLGWGMMAGRYGGTAPGQGGWMWGRSMHPFGMSWPWFGVVAGIVVLVGAMMLYVKPEQRQGWGLLILAVSAVNIFVGIGGLVAGVLGVIGGGLAMAGKT